MFNKVFPGSLTGTRSQKQKESANKHHRANVFSTMNTTLLLLLAMPKGENIIITVLRMMNPLEKKVRDL